MRILNIHINGFGIYNNFDLKGFSPGLNVLEGANEAGKTTLIAFIRSILFGFPDRRGRENRYPPVSGGRHGGTLTLEDQAGLCYTVERVPGSAAGKVTVYMPDSTIAGENILQEILGGLSRTLYRNVFAFGLEELQRLETLQSNEISNYIYSAGMGAGTVSPLEIEKILKSRSEQIFKAGGQRPKINSLLKKLETIQDKIYKLEEIPKEYFEIRQEREDLEQKIGQSQDEIEKLRRLISWLDKVVRAQEPYARLLQVEDALLRLPEINFFPENGIERWENLNAKLTEFTTLMEQKERRLQQLLELMENLPLNEQLLKQSAEVEDLFQERRVFLQRFNNLHGLQLSLQTAADELEHCLKLLGPDWSEEKVKNFNHSIVIRDEVRSYKQNFRYLQEQAKEFEIRMEEFRKLKDKCRLELDGLIRAVKEFRIPTAPTSESLEVREKALARFKASKIRLQQLEQELNHLAERENDIEEQQVRLQKQMQETQTNMIMWLLVIMLLVCAGIGVYSYYREGNFILPVVAVLLSAAAFTLYTYKNRSKKRVINTELLPVQEKSSGLCRQRRALQINIAQEYEKMQAAALVFLAQEHPGTEEVDAAEQCIELEKQALLERSLLEKSLAAKEEEMLRTVELLDRTKRQLTLIKEKKAALETEWEQFVISLELPQKLSPEGLEELFLVLKKAQEAHNNKNEAINKIKQEELEIGVYKERVNSVFAGCGCPGVEQDHVGEAVIQMNKQLVSNLLGQEQKKSYIKEINVLLPEIENLKYRVEKLAGEQKKLLESGGAGEEEEFRKRAVWYQERQKLLAERLQLENTLRLIAGSEEKFSRLKQDLKAADGDELRHNLEQMHRKYKEFEKKLSVYADQKGRLSQRLADLESNDQLQELVLTRETLRAELKELAREWGVNQICRELLSLSRKKYERERQPAVLRRASGYFEAFTRGKYRGVLIPLGETNPQVEKVDFTRLKVTELSRGTAEQLYLAMRFALVTEYAARVTPLPVIMDDILVNFDSKRLQAAVEAVSMLAQKQQVLFFTCHSHLAQQLKAQGSGVKYINLNH